MAGLGAVRSVFDWSYTRLDPVQARVFRLAGLHPVPEFGVHAVAALAGLDLRSATRVLEELAEQHLIEPVARHRYRMHDLLHDYAAYRADLDEAPMARDEAMESLMSWYAGAATMADRLAFPQSVPMPLEIEDVPAPIGDREQAMVWLRLERAALAEVQRMASDRDRYAVVVALAVASRHLSWGPRVWWRQGLEATARGIEAAVASGNVAAETLLRMLQGHSHRGSGEFEAAEAEYRAVWDVARRTGDSDLLQRALAGLGSLRRLQQRYEEAAEFYLEVWSIASRVGDEEDKALALGNLCLVALARERFAEALDFAQRLWELRLRSGDPLTIAHARHNMALARQGLDEHGVAITLWEQVVDVYAAHSGWESQLAGVLEAMAVSLVAAGRVDRAAHNLRRAAGILTDLGDPRAKHLLQQADDLALR